MKYLSLRILVLCVVFPPAFYVSSLFLLESVLEHTLNDDLKGQLISDPEALLQGQTRLEDEIAKNVNRFLSSCRAINLGMKLRVVVNAKTGKILYPRRTNELFLPTATEMFVPEMPSLSPQDTLEVAQRNLRIMERGIESTLAVSIPRNSWFANAILAFWILCSISVLLVKYRQGLKQAFRQRHQNEKALETANFKLTTAQEQLSNILKRQEQYQEEIAVLRQSLNSATRRVRETEDEALAEMEALETKLTENADLRKSLENEVTRLVDELKSLAASRGRRSKKVTKHFDNIEKRFKTLYKNLDIRPRAIEGFLELDKNLQLRAEELIHNLNDGGEKVLVKRKVFARSGSETTFESEFAYRGRLYWRKGKEAKIQVMIIGTKNSQNRDLVYLESL